jgi:hypothetical protein
VLDGDELARFASGASVITDGTDATASVPQPRNW